MRSQRKLHIRNSIPRAVFVAVSILLQVGWILLVILKLREAVPWIDSVIRLLSVLVVLRLNSTNKNPAYKMPWIMLLIALPVMGMSLYLLIGIFGDLNSVGKEMEAARTAIRSNVPKEDQALQKLQKQELPGAGLGRYLQERMQCPVYENTKADYFPEAADAFDSLKEDLEKAESFIFMEYFIVSGESAFLEIADVLVRKARQGVTVRLLYDDMGSVGYVNLGFAKRFREAGVQCMAFNPALPVLNLFMNHRDHRKMTVIDGKVGYTGGFNLSNEYFGRKELFGRWKDTGIRLEGEAVQGLTMSFLEVWAAISKEKEENAGFLEACHSVPNQQGFVQPYEDTPLGAERTAENVYLNLIYSARKSLYVMTPYLIITDEMTNALGMAAKRGVEVHIITPGVPDKKLVYQVTRSYYAGLVSQGVHVREYIPGFCHAKQMLCDGEVASIGTSNLDFRSLYLHFENNVLLYNGPAVKQMEADFLDLWNNQTRPMDAYSSSRPWYVRLGQYILRLFAPMM